ncbi:hypothetical protein KJC81_04765 (plasmid) [Borreliella garinii]
MVAKNRNGLAGTVTMGFIPKFTTFIDKKRQCVKISCQLFYSY